MTLHLQPSALSGEIAAMPSKADLHRLMIAAHLAGMDVTSLPVISEDIAATRDCLLTNNGIASCRESGSTLRFLLPVMAALGKETTFTGTGLLPERPIESLVSLLRAHGCMLSATSIPLVVRGQLQPGRFELPGNVSSQYITGLLFALPLLNGESEIVLSSPLESAGYVEMTRKTLQKFGVIIEDIQNGYHVTPQQYQRPAEPLVPEGDCSNAAFWLAAGVSVTGLDPDSAQPDKAIKRLLKQMGSPRQGIVMDAAQCPDLTPIMAVVMATARGESRIINAARLRMKECDRLHAMAQNLNALGGNVTELPDELVIQGKNRLRGGEVESFNDHRIAMAMAIAALSCDSGLTLHGAESVRKSYPNFWEVFVKLGGRYEF